MKAKYITIAEVDFSFSCGQHTKRGTKGKGTGFKSAIT
jgi:hypothetical protein